MVNADNVDAGKYYKIKLINLPQKNIRIERNQLFQFQCRIIKEVENPYDKDISEAFQRNTTNPTSNRRDAHLLKEIGKNMYSSKERMFLNLYKMQMMQLLKKTVFLLTHLQQGIILCFVMMVSALINMILKQ